MKTVAINSFVRRQTRESEFSHYEDIGNPEAMLVGMAEEALALGSFYEGYRPGVLCVIVEPQGFFSGIVKLKDGDKLVGEFKSRREGEEPRQSIRVLRERAEKAPAKHVELILYSHDTLAEDGDAETDADYELIAINAFPEDGRAPIEPTTLMHNHFGSDGGTATNMTPEQFEAALRESFEFWKDKGMLSPASEQLGE